MKYHMDKTYTKIEVHAMEIAAKLKQNKKVTKEELEILVAYNKLKKVKK